MPDIKDLISEYSDKPLALYGLGTETERFLNEFGKGLSVAGLLDGFRTDGEMFGLPVIPMEDTLSKGVRLIIVIARPGSCKAIRKRIGDFCRENGIALYDVRGNDLLEVTQVAYDFRRVNGGSKNELLKKIDDADVVSFDLFDTLVMRKTSFYTDVFELLDLRLKEEGIVIPDFPGLRLSAEKELSKTGAPKLKEIYDQVLSRAGMDQCDSDFLAEKEWETDLSLFTVRDAVRDVFKKAVSKGRTVVITTDCYYSREQLKQLLNRSDITGYSDLLVSCEYGTSKTQELFGVLEEKYKGKKILHIGDDEYADIEKAKSRDFDTFRLYSAADLFDALGGLDMEDLISGLSDRVKTGLFLSHIFNDPFRFEDEERRLSVGDSFDIGYLFCAPMITDFILWLSAETSLQGYDQILFGARDGFLPVKLYKMLDPERDSFYFLTSRTAAIRAGMENDDDISYVDGMKYFGSPEKALKVRFGIIVDDVGSVDKNDLILKKADEQRKNYRKYIKSLGIGDGKSALFDFVAKGTTQMYLQRLFFGHMKGFYFLQLEPEFMSDKGLDIEPFYSDKEKDTSGIFDNYYILETILTAPYPQMVEMDSEGKPVYAEETRSEKDIRCFERAQEGITGFFGEYLRILPAAAREINKKLDEKLLALINRVTIKDEDFLSLKVEDPFFGRMTDMKDVLGM